jgi:acetyl esterase
MGANAETQAFLDEIAQAEGKPFHEMSPAEAREMWHTVVNLFAGPSEDVAAVDDIIIPGPNCDLELRVYTPEGEGPFGALIYIHGGGWVIGTADTYQVACRALANATGCKVLMPSYRLAPEYKYPIPLDDCYAAYTWIFENAASLDVDADKIAIGGDSAGGNLAAAVTLMARDKGGPAARYQLLLYPVTDHSFDTGSYVEYADDHYLTRDAMIYFWGLYLPNTEAGTEPYASPLRADDLSGLPPALVITAECDVLRDEGEEYAKKLEAAGVPTTLSRTDGTVHGFVHPLGRRLPFAGPAVAEAAAAIRAALA